MNRRIYIVDRVDQVEWYLDTTSTAFCLQLDNNKATIREWLESHTKGIVVISGQGNIPQPGMNLHFTSMYEHIRKNQYKLYFGDDDDAVLFKLTWGGIS